MVMFPTHAGMNRVLGKENPLANRATLFLENGHVLSESHSCYKPLTPLQHHTTQAYPPLLQKMHLPNTYHKI